MIEAPKEDKKRAAVRTLVEALAQGNSITAGLAHLYRFTHPSQMERDLEVWRDQISDAVNDHERLLRAVESKLLPRSEVGPTALAIALWLTERLSDGLETPVEFDEIQASFDGITKQDLEEACFELEYFGLVETEGALGREILDVTPTFNLFWTFDPTVMKTDPLADAQVLAMEMVEDASLGNVAQLDEKMGWPRRRLNPALAHLMPLVRVKSNVLQNRYPTSFFSIQSEDRFQLKRFAQPGA
jgi:uncharacterized protein (DUF433 family)